MLHRNARSSGIWSRGIWVPTPAANVGFNTRTFMDDMVSLSTLDMSNTKTAGFNWYIDNIPTFKGSTVTDPPSNGTWSVSDSVLTTTHVKTGSMAIATKSFTYTGGSPKSINGPIINASGGFYIETRFKTNPADITDYVSFWMMDLAGLISQIENVGNGVKFAEIDILENLNDGTGFNQTVDEWPANNTSQAFSHLNNNFGSFDKTIFHNWGALIMPRSKNGGTGYIKFFIDDVQTASITWINNSDFMASTEAANFAIVLNGGAASMNIDYIGVWQ